MIFDVIEPNYGRILDPACGAGGMLVQSAIRVRNKLGFDPNKVISVYGQEKVDGTVKLCQMNLAVHGVSGLRNIREGNTYYQDIHNSVGEFDFVMANPPFNGNCSPQQRCDIAKDSDRSGDRSKRSKELSQKSANRV